MKDHYDNGGEKLVWVTNTTEPCDLKLMRKCAAVICTQGGPTCHAAIVARTYNVPVVVGVGDSFNAEGSYFSSPFLTVVDKSTNRLCNKSRAIIEADGTGMLCISLAEGEESWLETQGVPRA